MKIAPVRSQAIDFVRSLAVLSVLFGHYFQAVHAHSRGVEKLRDFLLGAGHEGVTLFFVVSGFLITQVLSKCPGGLYNPDFKDFYSRRFARLFPLLVVFTIVGLLLLRFGNPSSPSLKWVHPDQAALGPSFWCSIFFFFFNWHRILVSIHDSSTWFAQWRVLWTLAVEEQFYLFFPVCLLLLGTRKKLVGFLLCLVIFAFLFRWWAYSNYPQSVPLAIESSFGAFDQIAAGVLLFLLTEKLGPFFNENQAAAGRFCFYGASLILVLALFTNYWSRDWDRVFAPTVASAGAVLFLLGGLHWDFFNKSFLGLVSAPGRLSYGIYLLHSFFLVFLPLFSGWAIFFYALLYGCTVIAIAQISWVFFEMPFNQFIQKKLQTYWSRNKKSAP